jgi:hypothetical protein
MKRQLIILTIITLLTGCGNFSDNVDKTIDNAQKEANETLANDSKRDLKLLGDAYQKALTKTVDTAMTGKIKAAYASIITTTRYMDSLKVELKKYEKDPKSSELVEDIFIRNGIADSIFRKLKYSFDLSSEIAQTESAKTDINKRCANIVDETNDKSPNSLTSKKFLFFKLHSPEMEIWTLYGFESELVNCGIEGLTDFNETKTTANTGLAPFGHLAPQDKLY